MVPGPINAGFYKRKGTSGKQKADQPKLSTAKTMISRKTVVATRL
jgi:hypothetical protein